MAPMAMPAIAPWERAPELADAMEIAEELGNADGEDELVCVGIAEIREELGKVDSEGRIVCTATVEAVVRVKELCDELVADAK